MPIFINKQLDSLSEISETILRYYAITFHVWFILIPFTFNSAQTLLMIFAKMSYLLILITCFILETQIGPTFVGPTRPDSSEPSARYDPTRK